MAQSQFAASCPPNEWTQLTDGDVTNITFQALGDVYIAYTAGTTAPTASFGFKYADGTGEGNAALADRTSLSGANRVWARPIGQSKATVIVDNA